MFKYWFGRTGEINQFGFLSKVVPGRGNSNVKVLQCLMCLMKSKEIKMTKAEGVKGIPLGDEIREKSEVGSFEINGIYHIPVSFKLLVQKYILST